MREQAFAPAGWTPLASVTAQDGSGLKEAFLSAIEKKRPMLYSTMVAQAQRTRAPMQRMADAVSYWFVLAVIASALVTLNPKPIMPAGAP